MHKHIIWNYGVLEIEMSNYALLNIMDNQIVTFLIIKLAKVRGSEFHVRRFFQQIFKPYATTFPSTSAHQHSRTERLCLEGMHLLILCPIKSLRLDSLSSKAIEPICKGGLRRPLVLSL